MFVLKGCDLTLEPDEIVLEMANVKKDYDVDLILETQAGPGGGWPVFNAYGDYMSIVAWLVHRVCGGSAEDALDMIAEIERAKL